MRLIGLLGIPLIKVMYFRYIEKSNQMIDY